MASPVHPYSEYGVALRTLRSARSWLGLAMLLCVIAQFIGFALMFYTQQPYEGRKPAYTEHRLTRWDKGRQIWSGTQPTTAPVPWYELTQEGGELNIHKQWEVTYRLTVPVTQLAGLVAAASISIIVFITLLLVLVAQAPGVAQITRSLIWSVLLLFMFLPWQYFIRSFPIPGVLYGYQEMLGLIGDHVVPGRTVLVYQKAIVILRFMVWPALSMLVLLIMSERFRAGLMLAIGHPLQSMMQPRAGAKLPVSTPVGPKPPQNVGGGGPFGVSAGTTERRV